MKKVAVIVAVIAGLAALSAAIAIIYTRCHRCDDYCTIDIPFGQN